MRILRLTQSDLHSARQRRRLALLILLGVVLIGSAAAFLPRQASRSMSLSVYRSSKPAASTRLSRGFHFERMGGGGFKEYVCYFQTSSNIYTIMLTRFPEP